MARIAIIYGSRYGQTRKISGRIADMARARGHQVTLIEVNALPRGFSLAGVDAALVGAPVYYGRHHKDIVRYVMAHRGELERIPSAFFSVSGKAASPDAEQQIEARQRVDEFQQQTGWHPPALTMFGGAMANTQYNWLLRRVIVRISRREGLTIDPSRDYEYTDWEAVHRFADEFLDRLPRAERPAGVQAPEEVHAPSP